MDRSPDPETPEAQSRQAEGVMKLVGAVYELTTGVVRFLEAQPGGRSGNV